MGLSKTIWTNPSEFLRIERPVDPVMFFAPAVLQATAHRFLDGFPGLVTYAVKSNPDEMVNQNLVAAGVEGFDVASPAEIEMIARLAPTAALHYNHPVRARHELEYAVGMGVKSHSVARRTELAQVLDIPERYEILLVLALGKPKEEVVMVPIGPEGDIKYYRDANQVHYVPKRTLDEVLLP